jgi:hypothetical protein
MPGQNHDPWKEEDDQRLRELVEAGKSRVLVSAILKRRIRKVQERHRLLKRRSRNLTCAKDASTSSG